MLTDLSIDWHSSDYYISRVQNVTPSADTSPFRPEFYGLILCMEGWMDVMINGHMVHVQPNCFFSGGPEMIFQLLEQSPAWKARVIFFTKDFLLKNIISARQFESFDFFSNGINPCLQLSEKDVEPLVQLYDILIKKRTPVKESYSMEVIRNLFFAYVYESALIYQYKGGILPKQLGRETDLTYQFQQLLGKYCTSRRNLKFYADSLYISSKYLIYAIKKSTGKTPGELIGEAILAEAKRRLQDPGVSVALVAEELRFNDQAAFSKFFKRHTGYTPTQWRAGG